MNTNDAHLADVRVTVVIDLIGDLDATLGLTVRDTLAQAIDDGATDLVLLTKHVAAASSDGIAGLGSALATARSRGCSVLVEPGSRRMKAAFAAAAVPLASGEPRLGARSARHLMIARHAEKAKLARTA